MIYVRSWRDFERQYVESVVQSCGPQMIDWQRRVICREYECSMARYNQSVEMR